MVRIPKRSSNNAELDQVDQPGARASKAETGDPYASLLSVSSGEISSVLHVQRWEARQEPFTGFRSPPGRF